MPGGEVGAGEVADFTLFHEAIERFDGLLERRFAVPFMDMVDVDDVGLQPTQRRLAFAHDVVAAEAAIVRSGTGAEADLGRDQQPVAASVDQRRAKNFL
jgi:hypothetical protein